MTTKKAAAQPIPVEDAPVSTDAPEETPPPEEPVPEETQPPKDPVPDQVDPNDPGVVAPEPDTPVDPEDPNTYPDEDAPRGGGPLTTRKGP